MEANVGGTLRKTSLRTAGTVAGGALSLWRSRHHARPSYSRCAGALGVLCVCLTSLFCGGWTSGSTNLVERVASMTTLLSCAGLLVQLARAHDAAVHDYAYSVCLITLALTSISSFTAASSLRTALLSVGSRMAAIGCGGALAFTVSLVVLPEYAEHEAAVALASLLADASSLLHAAVEEHVEDGGGGGGGGGGFEAAHRELHALEARVTKTLERFGTLLGQAQEERVLRRFRPHARAHAGAPKLAARARAAAAARSVFTGAVVLLHEVEAGRLRMPQPVPHLPPSCSAWLGLSSSIRATNCSMLACFLSLADLVADSGGDGAAAARARASLASLEADVAALAAGVSRLCLPADSEAATALLRSAQTLGTLCFTLGDAAIQAAAVLAALMPDSCGQAGVAGAVAASGAMGAALRGAAVAMDALISAASASSSWPGRARSASSSLIGRLSSKLLAHHQVPRAASDSALPALAEVAEVQQPAGMIADARAASVAASPDGPPH